MQPSILGVLVLSALVATANAQEKADPQPAKGGTTAPPPTPVAPVSPKLPPSGNSWFTETNKDLGTYFGQGEAVGVYKFKNPNNTTIEWRSLSGSCQSAKATEIGRAHV